MKDFPINQKFDVVQSLTFNHMPLKRIIVGTTTTTPEYKENEGFSSKFHLLEYILSGKGEIVINNVCLPFSAGNTIFIKKKTDYSIRTNKSNPFKSVFIAFSCNYLSTMIEDYNLFSNVYKIDCAETFSQINAMAELPVEKSLSMLFSNAIHKIISSIPNSSHEIKQSSAQDIKQKLDSLLCKKCRLDDLSKELNISKSNIINVFKKTFGITPHQYVLNYKIEVAKEYLKMSTLSIKSISHVLAFESEHYFSHSFTQRVKISPTEYRKQFSLLNKN